MSNHMCNDDCFSNRTSHKHKINCTFCEKAFSLKCFGIVSTPCINLLLSDQNGFFFCGNCHDKIMKLKVKDKNESQKSRNSLNSRKRDTISSINKIEVQADSSIGANYLNSNDMMNLVNNKFDKLESISNDLNQKLNLISDFINKSALSDSYIHDSNVNNVTIENIFKQVLKLDDKVNRLHTIDDEKKNMQVILSTLDNKANIQTPNNTKSIAQNLLNPALNISSIDNWSIHNGSVDEFSQTFAGRPSLTVQQIVNDDIMDILKSSEQTTWQTLDYLTKEIRLQNEKIDTILQRTDGRIIQPIESPLVNTINLDELVSHNAQNGQSKRATGNFIAMEKQKEAIAQTNNDNHEIVPETFKSNMQKRQMPTLSGYEPGNGLLTDNVNTSESHNVTETFSNDVLINELDLIISSSDADNTKNEQPNPVNEAANICKELHLSKVDPNTPADSIIDYISSKTMINSKNDVRVFRLTKKGQDISRLKYVNFKIETTEEIASIINHLHFWPPHCNIAPFVRKCIGTFDSSSRQIVAASNLIDNRSSTRKPSTFREQ